MGTKRVKEYCPQCGGLGLVNREVGRDGAGNGIYRDVTCELCNGHGYKERTILIDDDPRKSPKPDITPTPIFPGVGGVTKSKKELNAPMTIVGFGYGCTLGTEPNYVIAAVIGICTAYIAGQFHKVILGIAIFFLMAWLLSLL